MAPSSRPTSPSPKAKTKTSRSKRSNYYKKTAETYNNKPLPALPPLPILAPPESRPSSQDGGVRLSLEPRPSDEDIRDQDPALLSILPHPVDIPHRPSTAPGIRSSAVPQPLNIIASPVELGAQTNTFPVDSPKGSPQRPAVPPRHPGRRRMSFNNRHAATGHRPSNKVQQLTGYDVDIYDDSRSPRHSSPHYYQPWPADTLFDRIRNLEKQAQDRKTKILQDGPSTPPRSPTSPFPVHGYQPYAGSPELGGDGSASASGSRRGSAQFSFSASSRPSWSSYSAHDSFDGKALSSRSRESLNEDEGIAFDYHRFTSEIAGPSYRHSGDSSAFADQSSAGSVGHSRQHSASSSNVKRSSGQSAGLVDFALQRTPFQQNGAPPSANIARKLSFHGRQKTASASFSKTPWSAESRKKRSRKSSIPKPESTPAEAETKPEPEPEPEPRSVFESDSEDDVGFSDALKGIFGRRSSNQHHGSTMRASSKMRHENKS